MQHEPIVRLIKYQKLRWFGHVERMGKCQKESSKTEYKETGKEARSNLKWIDSVARRSDDYEHNEVGWPGKRQNTMETDREVGEAHN